MTAPAREVATALRQRLPGLPIKKLHKLLYYAQGHHLAFFGRPLFHEDLVAYDMGPVVEKLWQEEKHGLAPDEHEPPARPLGEAELNTVGYVVSRYGGLTGRDLEVLSHQEDPWRDADARRKGPGPDRSDRIDKDVMAAWFAGPAMADEDVLPIPPDVLARLAAGARPPSDGGERPDDLDELRRFALEYEPAVRHVA